MQNILAGQEMLAVVLVITEADEVALERLAAVEEHLVFSRMLAVSLCERGATLSPHNTAHQLRANTTFRDWFEVVLKRLPDIYSKDFGGQFQPTCGWKTFDKEFRKQPADTLAKYDLFWGENV